MSQLLSTMWCDVRVQMRNGFYHAVGFVLLGWVLLFTWLPEFNWSFLLPALIFSNLTVGTFYFFGGLVLLEKSEGTLEAQVVTPLRTGAYLASKVLTLTALAVVESVVITVVAVGMTFRVVPLVAGVVLASGVYSLLGFVAVARYDSINEYLFPSFIITLVLSLPLLPYFGLAESPMWYLHPLRGSLLLMQASVQPVGGGALVYGVAYSLASIALAFLVSRNMFLRFIVAKEGGH
ncbi:MAG: ABC transporter permease [Gemmatimonadetes bacterium]|nr:ABC transporter permease [Gemmatimonadota bacterium]